MIHTTLNTVEFNRKLASVLGRAVGDTFATMVGVKPVIGQFQVAAKPVVHGDISGIINISGNGVEGAFILIFPKETVFHILARVYGNSFSEMNTSVQDAVAEFTNIIYGIVKTGLASMGMGLHMALPSVVIGDHHKVVSPQSGPCLILPVQILSYSFHAVIFLRPEEKA